MESKGETMMENELQNKSADERLKACQTLTDLMDTFSLQELVVLTQDAVLGEWLNKHFFEAQAERLTSVRGDGWDAVLLALVRTLEVDVTKLTDYEARLVACAVRQERERSKRERECGKDGAIVSNQEELIQALESDASKVYLYNETFLIPVKKSHITYVGRGNAVINILTQGEGETVLDFDGDEIYFYDLTIVFHFLEPRQVKIDCSKQNHNHIVFLHDDRIVQDDSIQPHELSAFLSGRDFFETPQAFEEKAKRFHGIIVGKVCLNAADYDVWHWMFSLKPIWRAEFIECLRRYVHDAKLICSISCEEAKDIFERERVQLVYADFFTDRDDAVIACLYLHTDGGKGKKYPIYLLERTAFFAFGSGSGGAGYGLHLIAVENN